MDYVFDKNDKNWPVVTGAHIHDNQLLMKMCEFGFRAVTNGAPGVGRAVLSGSSYNVQLPGTIVDPNKLVVSFSMAPDRDQQN
ncbi:MAG: hypothetical protein HYR67_02545 [Bacteroidetes bacterium]|nr:hypothetical protein [Bacteroidota bacterium]